MRIGFDLDGVIYPFTEQFVEYNKEHGFIAPEEEPAPTYQFYEAWGWSDDTFLYFHEDFVADDGYLHGDVIGGRETIRAMEALREAGHEIIIVTARHTVDPQHWDIEEQTLMWLEEHHVPYDELHFSKDKGAFDCKYFLDDKRETFEKLYVSDDVVGYLFDQPWNQQGSKTSYRVSSVAEYIERATGVMAEPEVIVIEPNGPGTFPFWVAPVGTPIPASVEALDPEVWKSIGYTTIDDIPLGFDGGDDDDQPMIAGHLWKDAVRPTTMSMTFTAEEWNPDPELIKVIFGDPATPTAADLLSEYESPLRKMAEESRRLHEESVRPYIEAIQKMINETLRDMAYAESGLFPPQRFVCGDDQDPEPGSIKLPASITKAIVEDLESRWGSDGDEDYDIHQYEGDNALSDSDLWADERNDLLQRFQHELTKATGDGSKKRQAGEKPPWYLDGAHEGAIFSHITKWKRGEKVDPDSGAHPLVHAAWRCLAIACSESGNTPDPMIKELA